MDAVRLHHCTWRDITNRASCNPSLAAVVQLADALVHTWNLDDETDFIPPNAESTARALNIRERFLNTVLDKMAVCLHKAKALIVDNSRKGDELPEWACGLAWKKVLIVQNKENDLLLLGTFLAKCQAIVKRVSYEEAHEELEEHEVVFLSLWDESDVEKAEEVAEDAAALEKQPFTCVVLNRPIDVTERLGTQAVLRAPISLTEVASLIRETAISVPVGEGSNG